MQLLWVPPGLSEFENNLMLSVSLPLHLGTPSGKITGLFGNFSQISLCLYLYLYLYLFLYLYFTVEFRLGPLFVPPCSGSRLAVGFFRQLIVTKQVQTNTNQTQNKYNSNKYKTNTKQTQNKYKTKLRFRLAWLLPIDCYKTSSSSSLSVSSRSLSS